MVALIELPYAYFPSFFVHTKENVVFYSNCSEYVDLQELFNEEENQCMNFLESKTSLQ